MPGLFGVFEVDRRDLEKREIALSVFRAPNLALDRIAGLQRKPPDLRRRYIDIIGTGQVIRIRRPQEAEPVLQDLDDAFADNFNVVCRKLLENSEHLLLTAHCAHILDLEFLTERGKFGRCLCLQILKFDFPHGV